MGNDESANRETDGQIYNASTVKRDESKWQSNVFAGPKNE
jgi:hypothetical protein